MTRPAVLAALALCAAAVPAGGLALRAGECRCTPPSPCWAAVPWGDLNASVGGRLSRTVDEMEPCKADLGSAACDAALKNSDDEFWLSARPGGYLHTGQYGVWNISDHLSAYNVAATTDADVQATVRFANQHNLRLVVKSTGHDWYGRSTAPGSLELWTHHLDTLTFENEYRLCDGSATVPAAVVGAGLQFRDLYLAAEEHNRLIIGGTCDSVGVGGCWLGGCYGTFSKLYGAAASNLLQAKVVLANGSLVVASRCSHPDLFYSLRGGAGGLGGVVTEYVTRTHRPPEWVLMGGGTFSTTDPAAFQKLTAVAINASVPAMRPELGGVMGFSRTGEVFSATFNPKGFELGQADGEAMIQPIVDFVNASRPGTYTTHIEWKFWNRSDWRPGQPLAWEEVHPDREISTELLGSLSRYPTLQSVATPEAVERLAAAYVNMTQHMPDSVRGIQISIDFEKGQAGASPYALQLLSETSINPVVRDALGLLLIMFNVPSLPQLPPSSTVLRALWPRYQKYIVTGPADPLFAACAAGAGGDEGKAVSCMDGWLERVPAIQARIEAVRQALFQALPDLDPAGRPFSGSYFHESDYHQADWQRAFWGSNYGRLLNIKRRYDPDGLFVCHHCVGSEDWSSTGNCRL